MDIFNNIDIASYIAENEQSFRSQVLLGALHDPLTLELMRIQGMERGLIEGHINLAAKRLLGNMEGATCEEIEARGAALKIARRAASKARGVAVISGIIGTPIPANLSINAKGKTFILDTNGDFQPAVIGASGKEKLSIISVTNGIDNNINATGYLDINISGINSLVEALYTSGATNEEDCKTEYRLRLLNGERNDAPIGSRPWYIQRALRYPNVTNACVSDCSCCPNEVDLYLFAAGFTNNIPDASFLQTVQSKVFDLELGLTQYSSKITGVKVNLKTAILSPLKITIKNLGNLPASVRLSIQNEITAFLGSQCVGGKYCKSDFTSIVNSFGRCSGAIEFAYNEAHFTQDSSFLQANCDIMPVLGEVCYGL